MFEAQAVLHLKSSGTEWVARRGAALAQMALVTTFELTIFENLHSKAYDYAVATKDGMFIRIRVEAYSSRIAGVEGVNTIPELRWTLSADFVRQARTSKAPVVLLLFDADTDHGRYSRLDVLPAPPRGAKWVEISLPLSNTVDPASLRCLVAELRGSHGHPADSSAA
ncbi:MAG TPA: hypothetical protein VF647_02350 [Longimicrobium sp.]|jgi:hypothetical protein